MRGARAAFSCPRPNPTTHVTNYSADAGAGSQIITNISESSGWRAALLGTVAAGSLWLYSARTARAQVVPPAAPCDSVVGTTVTCTGNVSPGVATGDPYTVLNVENLTADIAPAAGVDGIYFHNTSTVTINSDTTPFAIIATNADGIDAAAPGGVTITHIGDIFVTANNATQVRGVMASSQTAGTDSGPVTVNINGNIIVEANSAGEARAVGLVAATAGDPGYADAVMVTHTGGTVVQAIGYENAFVLGIAGQTTGIQYDAAPVTIVKSGNLYVAAHSGAGGFAVQAIGITAISEVHDGSNENAGLVKITNTGDIWATATSDVSVDGHGGYAAGITGINIGDPGSADGIEITNVGDIGATTTVDGDARALGIRAASFVGYGDGGPMTITQTGDIAARATGATGASAFGIVGESEGNDSANASNLTVVSKGNISASAQTDGSEPYASTHARGIDVRSTPTPAIPAPLRLIAADVSLLARKPAPVTRVTPTRAGSAPFRPLRPATPATWRSPTRATSVSRRSR